MAMIAVMILVLLIPVPTILIVHIATHRVRLIPHLHCWLFYDDRDLYRWRRRGRKWGGWRRERLLLCYEYRRSLDDHVTMHKAPSHHPMSHNHRRAKNDRRLYDQERAYANRESPVTMAVCVPR